MALLKMVMIRGLFSLLYLDTSFVLAYLAQYNHLLFLSSLYSIINLVAFFCAICREK